MRQITGIGNSGPENCQIRKLFEFIILQSLDARPMFEDALASYVSETFGILVNVKTVIETLENLSLQGLIDMKQIEPDEPPEPYHLTSKGRNMLTKTESTLISTSKDLSK